eukprot:5070655-Amphidinium_carterae.1
MNGGLCWTASLTGLQNPYCVDPHNGSILLIGSAIDPASQKEAAIIGKDPRGQRHKLSNAQSRNPWWHTAFQIPTVEPTTDSYTMTFLLSHVLARLFEFPRVTVQLESKTPNNMQEKAQGRLATIDKKLEYFTKPHAQAWANTEL